MAKIAHHTTHVYGFHAVNSVLKTRPQDIFSINIDGKNSKSNSIVQLANTLGIKINNLTEKEFLKMSSLITESSKVTHQGIIAEVKPKMAQTEQQLKVALKESSNEDNQLWLILDRIQDPQNFGSIIRNAESAGCKGIIYLNHDNAPLSPTVSKVSCGAVEIINLYLVANLSRAMQILQEANIWCTGLQSLADGDNKTEISNYYSLNLVGKVAVVLGSEGAGLRQRTIDSCDQLAYLPMIGNTPSLNVASTSAIVLFEVLRQQAQKNYRD